MNPHDTANNTPAIHEHTSDARTIPQIDRAAGVEGQALPTQGHCASNPVDDLVVACRDFEQTIRADRLQATRTAATDHFVDPAELRAKSREEHGARIDQLHEDLLLRAHQAGCLTAVKRDVETVRYYLDAFEDWSYAPIEAYQRYQRERHNGSPLDDARTQFNAALNNLAHYRTILSEAVKPSDTFSHATTTTPTVDEQTRNAASLVVDADRLEIRWRDSTCRLDRSPLLFWILHRLDSARGTRVRVSDLIDQVWRRKAEETTVHGAVSRLRRLMRKAGMAAVAETIQRRDHAYWFRRDYLSLEPQ